MLLLTVAAAQADEPPPITPEQFELARTQVEEGIKARDRGELDLALEHFRAAYALAPSPEIKQHILDVKVRRLEAHVAPPAPAPQPIVQAHKPSLRVPALALLGVSIALAAGGVGAWFSEWSEYTAQRHACLQMCAPSSLDGLRTRVADAQIAGAVLWSLAGAALVADVVLWIVEGRRHRERNFAMVRF
jgi:hypothetical protein